MLLYISELLSSLPGMGIFKYITFRTALAGFTSLMFTLALGPWVIRILKQMRGTQPILSEAPDSHQTKAGTPTMGGLLMIAAIFVSTIFWTDLRQPAVWIAIATLLSFGAIGFVDDYQKLTKQRNEGLNAFQKTLAMGLVTLVLAIVIFHLELRGLSPNEISFPFFKNFKPDLGFWILPWMVIVIMGTSNGVNLTDGLDGLAAGTLVIASFAFAFLTYVATNIKLSSYLVVPYVASSSELTIILGAVAGACLGFLWFNAYPAEIFMGDTGSLSIGATLGVVALLIKQEILILLVGGVFFLESMSVILQVGSFKLRSGKRIFKMAPFHHHMELMGIPETKVVIRLWVVAIILSLVGLSSLKLR